MIEIFDFILEMTTMQFIFMCLCIVCVTLMICAFFRIFWKK